MRPFVDGHEDAAVWDLARPERPSRVAGVAMTGFRAPGTAAGRHRGVPHPAVTLVVEFGAGPLVVDDGAGAQYPGGVVAGLGFGHGVIRTRAKRLECVRVRLSPVVARAVLGASPADLAGAAVALDDLWGREASRLREQLADVSGWEDRFALADTVLARRRRERSPVDAEVTRAWDRIVGSRGLVRVDELAADVGWSRKRLWSRFQEQIGLPPKRAARLVRFEHAARRLAAGENPAAVAAASGFADQSHLHRDIVAFTGATPALLARDPLPALTAP